MKEIDQALKNYLEETILPCYKDYGGGHGIEHIETVIRNSFDLIKDLDVDPNMVYVIAAYHDIGIRFGRKDHEITSAKWLAEDQALINWFSQDEIQIMKETVEDHRASNNTPPRSIYGRIVSEADRDIDPLTVVERCVAFENNAHPNATKQEKMQRIKAHLIEKYGDNGYLKLWLPCKRNEEGLATLRRWIGSSKIDVLIEQYLHG